MTEKILTPQQQAARESLERALDERRAANSLSYDPFHGGVRILRRPEVERRTGLSRSTIYAMMDEGSFPRPLRLGKRAVGWPDHIIAEFLQSRSQTGEVA